MMFLEQPCPACGEPALGHSGRGITRSLCRDCFLTWITRGNVGDECESVIAAGFVATTEEARELVARMTSAAGHAADFDRTCITPGADPCVCWSPGEYERVSGITMTGDWPKAAVRGRWRRDRWTQLPEQGLVVFELRHIGGGTRPYFTRNPPSAEACYVPIDVWRWREPAHQASMRSRAKAHAAIVPGRRS